MVDIFLEVTGSFFAAVIFVTLLRGLRQHNVRGQPGTRLVVAGFGLLFFSLLIDITDNFPALNYLILVGDTEPQAFLEKVVGMLLGLLLLAWGFRRWIPSIMALENARKSLDQLNAELDRRVTQRTLQVESANRQLTEEVAERRKVHAQLTYRAMHDALTGLPNRAAVVECLEQLAGSSRRDGSIIAVLLLDLDDFKKVNNHLGREVGDNMLLQAKQRLAETVPPGSVLGCTGGDQFSVVLPDVEDPESVSSLAKALLQQIRCPFTLAAQDFLFTASIGIAIYPGDAETPQALLGQAETAMHCAKQEGRNAYRYFTDAMNLALARRLALEEQMYGALERHEFSLRYQPVVDAVTQEVNGAEVLLRWHNPVLGDVSPDEFIPIAEKTGLILPIGRYVLTTALHNLVLWRARFNDGFELAVNISPLQFRQANLAGFIAGALQQAGLPGSALVFEITEGLLMDGSGVVEESLAAIDELGIGLSLDDFGTGYSSLSYLRRYPFDILKVDRSFVNDIEVSQGGRELVSTTISMAHSLGLKVVAEGVETAAQLSFLRRQGCDLIQGYYFSQPLLADDFERYLDSRPAALLSPEGANQHLLS